MMINETVSQNNEILQCFLSLVADFSVISEHDIIVAKL